MKAVRKVVKTIENIDPLFKVNEVVILKDNLLAVVIGEIFVKRNKYYYRVRYNHLDHKDDFVGWFNVCEEEMMYKPLHYESLLMEKYLDYKCKYEHLLFQLTQGKEMK